MHDHIYDLLDSQMQGKIPEFLASYAIRSRLYLQLGIISRTVPLRITDGMKGNQVLKTASSPTAAAPSGGIER